MNHHFSRGAILLWLAVLSSGCQSYSGRLAGAGGLTGALAGAAIGSGRGNPLGGAVVGGALGAVGGAAVGDAIDESSARAQALAASSNDNGGVSAAEVVQMTRAGLSADVIANHVQTHGLTNPLGVNDLLWLRNNGVPDEVIVAMQQSEIAAPSTLAMPVTGPPTVIVQEVYAPPTPSFSLGFRSHPYPMRRPGPRGGVHWGVSLAH